MIVIVLIAVIVAIVVVLMMKKNKSSDADSESFEKKFDLDKPAPSTIHFSDDFKSGEPITTVDNNHVLTTILMCKEDPNVWVCPSCETENLLSKKYCCVCHYVK